MNEGGTVVNEGGTVVNEGGTVVNEGGTVVNEGGTVVNEGVQLCGHKMLGSLLWLASVCQLIMNHLMNEWALNGTKDNS